MPQNSQAAQITGWTSWRENYVDRRAEYYSPSGYTLLAEAVLYKAGTEYWLAWLNSLPNQEQTASLLMHYCGRNLTQALGLACRVENFSNIKTLLFCVLVSKERTPSEHSTFLNVIQSNPSVFFDLCLEVLSDFLFLLAYPENTDLCQSLAAICAGEDALSRLSAASPMTIGPLCVWAELLSQTEPTEEQLSAFKFSYLGWISSTGDYMFTTMQGRYYKRELRLLEFAAETYAFDESFETEMKALLEKKAYVYHGWPPEETPRQQWFLHIGLLLWLVGLNRDRLGRGENLMLYVLEKLNLIIPMVLIDNDYSLLLSNVFCLPRQASPEIDTQLVRLIRKIFEPLVLRVVAESYLAHACHSARVLRAMEKRLRILLELPQRKRPTDPDFPGQELLSELETALSKIV
ncbi:hypothetical protein [Oscillibacter sp. CU971]|uniref:hypothetical protein n=1 Tax=Oscillibacter sp. CU971 TaxID=2780102 RepID=UPI00195E807E|nr:hypothetical protein [Oscillibacter sp. CU971]